MIQQSDFFRDVLGRIGEGILVVDTRSLCVMFSNSRVEEQTGCSDLVGRHVEGINWLGLSPAQLSRFIHSAVADGQRHHLEFTSSTDGKTYYHELLAIPMPLVEPDPPLVLLVERDLTETKQFEKDLSRQVQQLRKLNEFSKALQGNTDLAEGLFIILVSVTASEGLGFNRAFILMYDQVEQILQGTVALGPYDAVEAGNIWGQLLAKRLSLPELLASYSQNRNYQQTRINDLARQIHIPGLARNNILIRAMQQGRSFNVVHGACEGERIDDETKRLLRCDSFAVIPLYTRHKRIGVLVADNSINLRPIEAEDIRALEIFANHASAAIEITMLYKELREKVHDLELSSFALRENQAKLVRAERLSAIGKMAATIAHEIRNPLVSIGGFARCLARDTPSSDSHNEDVAIIISEVMRLEKIVENIIQYAQAHQVTLQQTDLHQIINECVTLISEEARARGLQIEVTCQDGFPQIEADGPQLKQVFLNLLVNAMHAAAAGGRIRATLRHADDYVDVQIADTGCGIPAENLDKIFSAFFTTKGTGTGLGLTVVAQIVEAHNGFITVNSRPREGTEFTIRFPVTQRAAAAGTQAVLHAE